VSTHRQNRSGARDGLISADLQAALPAEVCQLASIDGAVEQVKTVNDFFAQLDVELEQFTDVRFDAASQLRAEGMSYDRTAEATGLSKARVARLARAAQRDDDQR
jgi:uncharacterized protein YerC